MINYLKVHHPTKIDHYKAFAAKLAILFIVLSSLFALAYLIDPLGASL